MRDALGPGTILGYCTNVHAGVTWPQMRANLKRHALAVRERVCRDDQLGVGLWLSAPVARDLVETNRIGVLRDFLFENGLMPYTINGFPYGDFHQQVVKHRVYRPNWGNYDRAIYTRHLVEILHGILPAGQTGSISTVPVGWGTIDANPRELEISARSLVSIARRLQKLEDKQGRLIHVDLEPEPGCFLERASDVAEYFRAHLLPIAGDVDVRRYVRVCHDVCHGAVMFEEQAAMFRQYDADGILVGKVQLSSAIRADFDAVPPEDLDDAGRELAAFREMRYLHQTVVRDAGGSMTFYEDLPYAFDARTAGRPPTGEWRVHYHVPIYLDRIGHLGTTRRQIAEALALLRDRHIEHWEVETYAWDVLPAAMQRETLAEGIAAELQWVRKLAAAVAHRAAS